MNKKLYIELLEAKVADLKGEVQRAVETEARIYGELASAEWDLRNAQQDLEYNEREFERLHNRIMNLEARLAPYEEQERQQSIVREQDHIRQQHRVRFADTNPVDLLPDSVEAEAVIREVKIGLADRKNYIPTIKAVRENVPNFGLKEAKDFVDCVQAHIDIESDATLNGV